MIRHEDVDAVLFDWFAADAEPAVPEGGLERLIAVTRRRSPRPAWLAAVGSHWLGRSIDGRPRADSRSRWRLDARWTTALIALLVVSALVAGALFVGARLLQPSPTLRHLGHLAYAKDASLVIADWNGANPVPVANALPNRSADCDNGHQPTWSPDGRYLAYRFELSNPCVAAVAIADAAGRLVTSFPGEGWLIAWSPDSTRIATWIEPGGTVGVYGLDGQLQARVRIPAGYGAYRDEDSSWSPDGNSLLVSLRPDSFSLGGRGTWELPIAGGTPRQLPDNDPRSSWHASSVDGQTVASAEGSTFVIATRDGSHVRRIVTNDFLGSEPLLTPMGDRIAYAVETGSDPAGVSGAEIHVVDVTTGSVATLASVGDDENLTPIRFSPEGDRILYGISDANNDGGSLWSAAVDGAGSQLLVANVNWTDLPGDWQWLPAGS